MKKIIISILIILIFGFLVFLRLDKTVDKSGTKKVIITNQAGDDVVVNVEVADTKKSQAQGLSDRKELKNGDGMLFIFPGKEIRSFWMKNMNFGLDIIWLDGDEITKISQNLPPERETPQIIYSSGNPVNYVLEVPAGFCEKNNIKIGNKVFYNY